MAMNLELAAPGCMLGALLLLAVWHDVRTHRIPNRLVFAGAIIGLLLNTFLPTGAGFFSDPSGALGFRAALGGAGIGLAILLPIYAVGAMGAGDVKLMAMVGAFLGPEQILGAGLLSLIAGGALALCMALWTGTLTNALHNTYLLLLHSTVRAFSGTGIRIDKPVTPASNLPYAIAIMLGTGLDIILRRENGWNLLS